MPPRPSKKPPRRPKLPSRPPTPPPFPSTTGSQPSTSSSNLVAAASHSSMHINNIPMSGLHLQSDEPFRAPHLPPISQMDWAPSKTLPPLNVAGRGSFYTSSHGSYPAAWSPTPSPTSQPPTLPLSGTPVPTSTQPDPALDPAESDKSVETTRPKTLHWTGAMEKLALQLYSDAVLDGKRSDGGFKSEVHNFVVTKLNEQFPGYDFTPAKCKSKLSQSFKKEYEAFNTCRHTSGFGWDDVRCEVTASNEVWESFLKSHPQARRFRNQPFPEWEQLNIIFGSTAKGDLAKTLTQRAREGGGRDPANNDSSSSDDDNAEDKDRRKPPARKRIRQTTGAAFSSAIHDLIDAFAPKESSPRTNAVEDQSPEGHQKPKHQTDDEAVTDAVALFQTTMAPQLAWSDVVIGFSVLEKPSKARMYLRLEAQYKDQWLSYEIKKEGPMI
ncbi:hypothetical protein PGT21_034168 [Puccinia graminis f. sp. tritici]|uniref:Myb/SANT-like domain-containing protein n=2 Tax=Puccinia graminis f. sp. tritici TaxID=56615 RepID=E3K4X5_PUCGT|nr:uncharacterized protein PGTG_05611 [Puccinia graminis f. sp. tritici CRL 75-36-700-3]EFP79290.1 hypothetical protein PGTG_05611 [Puccinia graminis f. sp. tritici CRL 75-36-700-3]KAA1101953.1 hypothetical protein PGT21_034168 [Puccinia graminis f. sp. tritici]